MSITLSVEERAVRPRSIKNKLRKEGKIPAVVHGNHIESTPITIDEKELQKILRDHGRNALISMTVKGNPVNALVAEQQVDTFSKRWKHIEFIAVNMNEKTEVEAEISLINEATAIGVKEGGIIAQYVYQVKVSATPDKLPESVEVDVAKLKIGDVLTIGSLLKNADYDVLGDPDEPIVGVIEAPVEVEEEKVEEAAPTEE